MLVAGQRPSIRSALVIFLSFVSISEEQQITAVARAKQHEDNCCCTDKTPRELTDKNKKKRKKITGKRPVGRETKEQIKRRKTKEKQKKTTARLRQQRVHAFSWSRSQSQSTDMVLTKHTSTPLRSWENIKKDKKEEGRRGWHGNSQHGSSTAPPFLEYRRIHHRTRAATSSSGQYERQTKSQRILRLLTDQG